MPYIPRLNIIHRTLTIPGGADHEAININEGSPHRIGHAEIHAVVLMNLTQTGPPSYKALLEFGTHQQISNLRGCPIGQGMVSAYHDFIIHFNPPLQLNADQILHGVIYGEASDEIRMYVLYERAHQ